MEAVLVSGVICSDRRARILNWQIRCNSVGHWEIPFEVEYTGSPQQEETTTQKLRELIPGDQWLGKAYSKLCREFVILITRVGDSRPQSFRLGFAA
jgi:hypothetical protein